MKPITSSELEILLLKTYELRIVDYEMLFTENIFISCELFFHNLSYFYELKRNLQNATGFLQAVN